MRVRFAPSPTGDLHIGGARTALYNWLLARQSGGTFVLRIEDTDRERSSAQSIEQILEGLRWLQLDWDEGPISQAERADRHTEVVEQLLDSGHAYRSTATAEDIQATKAERGGAGYRGQPAPADDQAAVRLRVPDDGETVVEDLIRGESRFENRLFDDFVIARTDNTPLYNLAVAVDDMDTGVTHVVRGDDHLSNTPRQLLILKALGKEPPLYAHLPLLHGQDGKKLSKRHGAMTVQELRDRGYLPAAVRNYLALLGWSFDDKTTIFSTPELIDKFSIGKVSKSPAVFDPDKLRWLNGQYLRAMAPTELASALAEFLGTAHTALGEQHGDRFERAAALVHEKIATLGEFWPLASFFFEPPEYDEQAWQKVFGGDDGDKMLRLARGALAAVEDFEEPAIEAALRAVVEHADVKPKAVFQPVRVAISGKTVSPGIFESLALLGREESLQRIDEAVSRAARAPHR